MKRYFLKIVLFLIPIALVFVLPLAVSKVSRELMPLKEIVKASLDEDVLVGLAYSNIDKVYKESMIRERKPQVMSLGTSRVLQFRSEFFREPNEFYNAGAAVEFMPDLLRVLSNPGTENLELVIVGIDPHLLNLEEEARWGNGVRDESGVGARTKSLFSSGWKTIYSQYFQGEFGLRELFESASRDKSIGLTALIKHKGFRSDGSYDPGAIDPEILRRDIETRSNFAGPFEYGTEVSAKALESLEEFLALAKEKGIHVVGFSPPYASAIKSKIEDPNIIEKQNKILKNLFAEYNHTFFDLSSPQTFGSDDDELIDAIHGSDKMYKKALRYMALRDLKLFNLIAW